MHVPLDEDAETELAYQFEQGGDYACAIHYLIIASLAAAKRCEVQHCLSILQHAMDLAKKIPHADRGRMERAGSDELATVQSAPRSSTAPGRFK